MIPARNQAVCLLVAIMTASSSAAAEDRRAEAREAFEEGVTQMREERWQEALARIRESYAAYPTQVALLNIAVCLDALGRWPEALEELRRFDREFGRQASPEREAELERVVARVRLHVGQVRVRSNVDGATVLLDGRDVGATPLGDLLYVDAGDHRLELSSRGRRLVRRVHVRGGAQIDVAMVFAPATGTGRPAGRRARSHIWLWSTAGLAAVAAATTTVLGVVTLESSASYAENEWRTSADREAGLRLANATDVALAVTVAAGVGALVLWLAEPSRTTVDD